MNKKGLKTNIFLLAVQIIEHNAGATLHYLIFIDQLQLYLTLIAGIFRTRIRLKEIRYASTLGMISLLKSV